jgi:hypothetical protein
MRSRTALAFLICSLAAVAWAPAPAAATGTMRIQHGDGDVRTYQPVTMRAVRGESLTIVSPDGRGTLVIDSAACSFVHHLLRCALTDASYTQTGEAPRPLSLAMGTLYANLTADPHQLPFSSQVVGPNGIVLSMRTVKGTYISVLGTLDEVTK